MSETISDSTSTTKTYTNMRSRRSRSGGGSSPHSITLYQKDNDYIYLSIIDNACEPARCVIWDDKAIRIDRLPAIIKALQEGYNKALQINLKSRR